MAQSFITDVGVTVDTNAYASGDCVGGKLSTTAAPVSQHGVILTGVTLASGDSESPQFDIYLFSGDPSTSTLTDNAALALTDADREKVIDFFQVSEAVTDSNGVTYRRGGLSTPIPASVSTLYIAIVARGAITYAAATDLNLRLLFVKD